MRRLLRVLVVAIGLLTIWTTAPRAAEPDQIFEAALAHYDQGRYAAALPQFERALASSHSPNARLYVARCLRELGRTVEAHEHMSATVEEASVLADAQPRYAATRDQAKTELAALDRRVARLVVTVDESAPPTRVLLNGVDLAADGLGETVAVAPGVVALEAYWTDGRRGNWRFELAGGELRTIGVAAPAAGGGAEPHGTGGVPDPTSPADDADAEGMSALQVLGAVTTGVGVVGLVVFGVSYGMAVDKFDEIDAACGGTHCADPSYAEEIDDGRTLETTAFVALGVGAAAVLGGTLLILFGAPSSDEDATAQVVPYASTDGGGLGLRGVF